jgi:hypothetical protein
VSEFKHYRINHSKLFARKHNHINGIENFWNQAKRHMRKFNGIDKKNFNLFLKECEWRVNIGGPWELLIDLKKLLKEFFKNLRCQPHVFKLAFERIDHEHFYKQDTKIYLKILQPK